MKKLYSMASVPTKKLTVQCDCAGEHYLQLFCFERQPSDNLDEEEYEELYITISGCEMSRWIDRFKTAWRIIRWGEFQNNGVAANTDELKKIVKYINSVIRYWEKLRKEIDAEKKEKFEPLIDEKGKLVAISKIEKDTFGDGDYETVKGTTSYSGDDSFKEKKTKFNL